MNETVKPKLNAGIARSIKTRFGQEAYELYKETGQKPDGYDIKPKKASGSDNRFTVVTLQAAQRHWNAATDFRAKGYLDLARERLVISRDKARVCLDNCQQYFGEWEAPYWGAQSLLEQIDKVFEELRLEREARAKD